MRSTEKQHALTLPLLWFYELRPQEMQSLLMRLLLRENVEKSLAPLPDRAKPFSVLGTFLCSGPLSAKRLLGTLTLLW